MATLNVQELIDKYASLLTSRVARISDPNAPQPYRWLRMLTLRYKQDGRFSSTNGKRTRFVMDLVAPDSPLPLKKRDSIGTFDGVIPKMGNKMTLNENEMDAIDALLLRYAGVPDNTAATPPDVAALQNEQRSNYEAQVVSILFGDAFKLTTGAFERLESDFLEGLSTGVLQVDDADTIGKAIRIDYGYEAANKTDSTTAWGQAGATPVTDLEAMMSKAQAKGKVIRRVMMDRPTFNRLRTSDEGKLLFATSQNITVTGTANITAPNLQQLNAALESVYGFTIEIVEKVSTLERNGNQTTYNPWAAGAVVGLVNPDNVGTAQWKEVAEENRRVEGKRYQKPTAWSLVGIKRESDPISETTDFQAKICVVLENVDDIFHLDTLKTLA